MKKSYFVRNTTKLSKPKDAEVYMSRKRKLTAIEENAIRYTAGFVIRKIEKKYEQKTTKEGRQCTSALKEMGGKLSNSESIPKHYSCEYLKLIDRGGLYHVQPLVYQLFVAIELLTNERLSTIFRDKGENIEQVTKGDLEWVCGDEEGLS